MPRLTICVPSRNRQRYFQETIRALLKSLRTDVEFIFADNSDDPSIMNTFMTEIPGDPRVTYLPTTERTLSMQDNWERTVEIARGDFISIVGDDDYIDPDAAGLIERVLARNPAVDAIAWSRPCYIWPGPREQRLSVVVELGDRVVDVQRAAMWSSYFNWEKTVAGIPQCPFSIYHAAISRDLMDRIQARFGGRYFAYPAPDIETTLKVLSMSRNLAYSERPFSVAGICQESNGSSFGNIKKIKQIQANFARDLGRDMEKDEHFRGFPFPSHLGNCIIIAQVQVWFRKTYGLDTGPWETKFVEACAQSCDYLLTQEDYDIAVADFHTAFALWQDGRYAHLFTPKPYQPKVPGAVPYTGRATNTEAKAVYVAEDIAGTSTCGDFFDVVRQMMPAIDQLDMQVKETIPAKASGQARPQQSRKAGRR